MREHTGAETGDVNTSSPGQESVRCAFVGQWYPPEPVVAPQRIALALREAGLDVSVLTGVPHYPSGVVRTGYGATSVRDEVIDGIKVRRTPEYPSHSHSALGRLLNYASWAASATFLGGHIFRDADVALVYSSPATAGIPALARRLITGLPYVLLVQDVWPDSIFAAGFGSVPLRGARRVLEFLCNRLYAHASHICVISPGMIDLLVARGVPRRKLSLVYNWREGETSAPFPFERRVSGAPRRLLYAGNHGPSQNLTEVIRAVAEVPDVELTLLGDGIIKPELQKLVDTLGISNVIFRDRVSPGTLMEIQKQYDGQLVSLSGQTIFETTMPSKFQNILSFGIPVVGAVQGDVARVIESTECGWTADPEDSDDIARALREFSGCSHEELVVRGAYGQQFYQEKMSKETNLAVLAHSLRRAASLSKRSRI